MLWMIYLIVPRIGAIFGMGSPPIRPIALAIFKIDKPTIARGKNFTTISFVEVIV